MTSGCLLPSWEAFWFVWTVINLFLFTTKRIMTTVPNHDFLAVAHLTLPVLWSNQTRAWFLDSTLQSKVALFCAGRQRATDRPILTGSSRYTCLSWNGCELGRQANTASAEGIDFGLRVLLQPDTRDGFSWSRVAGVVFRTPEWIINCIWGLRSGAVVSLLLYFEGGWGIS